MNFKDKLVGQAYMAMIQGLERYNTNLSNGISSEKFMKGESLCIQFDPGSECGRQLWTTLSNQQSVWNQRLETKFTAPLPKGINVIIMAIWDGRLEITKQRQVLKS